MLIAGFSGLQNALRANVGKSPGMLRVGSNGRKCLGLSVMSVEENVQGLLAGNVQGSEKSHNALLVKTVNRGF